ncbi:MAG: phosphodiester glycosidase family protein [Planctomycetia bacterium]|nr:phosphodiester glycosidase family protein [Planctomycetia bacterium]
MKKKLTTLLVLVTLSLTGISAFGQDATIKWTPVYDGLSYTALEASEPLQKIFVARIDTSKAVSYFVTERNTDYAPDERETWRETTAGFLKKNDLEVAINANFYSPFTAQTIREPGNSFLISTAVSDGVVVSTPTPDFPTFAIHKDGKFEIRAYEEDENLDDIEQAVAGSKIVLKDGKVPEIDDDSIHPRSAIGYSADQRYLYLVAIDGRQEGYSVGAKLEDVGKALLRVGASEGLNLDGGGSTTLVFKGSDGEPIVVNRPCNGTVDKLRFNGNSFGVNFNGELKTELKDGRK